MRELVGSEIEISFVSPLLSPRVFGFAFTDYTHIVSVLIIRSRHKSLRRTVSPSPVNIVNSCDYRGFGYCKGIIPIRLIISYVSTFFEPI